MFKHALSMVLAFLGVDTFSKKEGKSVISEEQKKQLAEEYGDQFVQKFEADLAKYESTGDDPLRSRLESKLTNLESIVEQQRQTLSTLQTENSTLKTKVEKLSDSPVPEPMATFETKDGKRKLKFNVNKSLAHNRMAIAVQGGDHRVLAAGETIDTDSVITEFNELVNYVKLPMISEIFQEFETAKHLTWERGIHSWKATRSQIDSVIQQFVPKWTPLGKSKFTPLEIPLRRFKINVPITPADVEKWILNMYDESVDLDQHPVTIYIVNNLIKPRALDDLDYIAANGVFDELDWSDVDENDEGQDPVNAIDGFLTLLRKDKALGASKKMNFIALNDTLTQSNILAEVEKFVDAIDKKYKRRDMPVFIDPTLYRMYKRAYKNKYGLVDGANANFGGDIIDFSRNRLVPMYNMTESGAMFTTPPENFVGLRHKNEPGATLLWMRKYDYDIHCLGEFRFGIGFAIAEAVFYYIPDVAEGSSPVGSGGAGV